MGYSILQTDVPNYQQDLALGLAVWFNKLRVYGKSANIVGQVDSHARL